VTTSKKGTDPFFKKAGAGFTLLEATIATFLALLLLLGLLAVCDSAAILNKTEIAAVEAQGSLRQGLDRIAGVVRSIGAMRAHRRQLTPPVCEAE